MGELRKIGLASKICYVDYRLLRASSGLLKVQSCLRGLNSVLPFSEGKMDTFKNVCPFLYKWGESRDLFLYLL